MPMGEYEWDVIIRDSGLKKNGPGNWYEKGFTRGFISKKKFLAKGVLIPGIKFESA